MAPKNATKHTLGRLETAIANYGKEEYSHIRIQWDGINKFLVYFYDEDTEKASSAVEDEDIIEALKKFQEIYVQESPVITMPA